MGPYLTYSDTDWDVDWRLVNHLLVDDTICVTREELSELPREAVHRRVAEGLPFAVRGSDVGDRLTDALRPHIECLRNLLSNRGTVNIVYVDTMDPNHFPSYVRVLLARAWEDKSLPNETALALAALLVGVGLDLDKVGGVVGGEAAETLQKRVTVLADPSESQYAPPTCETTQAYDPCVNRDDRCDTTRHLMNYFETATNDADADAADEAVD